MIRLDADELSFIEAAVSMYHKDMQKYPAYFDVATGDVEAVNDLLLKIRGFLLMIKAPDNPETE